MNVKNVIVDEKGKKEIEKKQGNSVYCYLRLCRSWSGTRVEPTVLVGEPHIPEEFEKFSDNGITVYVHKDTPSPSGTLKITVGSFLWFEKLIVEGMDE